jgi:protein-disulfide isomerase
LLLLVSPARSENFTEAQRADIEKIIKAYLIDHPEGLRAVMLELKKRESVAEESQRQLAIKKYVPTLIKASPYLVLGNAEQGNVTVVEFFDYNCAHCKNSAKTLAEVIKKDKGIRVQLEQLPILGADSVAVARIAAAAKLQDRDGRRFMRLHQRLLDVQRVDKDRALAIAGDVGFDVDRLKSDMQSGRVMDQAERNLLVARELKIIGTPAFLIGDKLVQGEISEDSLLKEAADLRTR